MDDATRLIANLQDKLAELDQKVATYRQGLADEFTRHSHQLLRDLPESLSATVQGTVARSVHKYSAISPALTGAGVQPPTPRAESPKRPSGFGLGLGLSASTCAPGAAASTCTAPANASTPGTGATATSTAATATSRPADHEDSSPASRLPRPATPPLSLLPPQRPPRPTPPSPRAGTDDLGHMSDSPDDREAELRGVFTPSFLPLLDTSYDRMPSSPKSRAPRNNLTPTTTMDGSSPRRLEGGGSQLQSSPLASAPASAQVPIRPPTIRRGTDDLSTSSALSDKSDSKSRRSALRRSSSASKPQSPRRVRFEFAGAEVLPTTSPSNSLQDVRQPLSDDKIYTASVSELEDDSTKTRSLAAILGLADTEDDEPPPKKVSSSQALRALSRLPLDSDTVWTPVTQESTPEPDSEEQGRDAVEHISPLNSEPVTAAARSAGQQPSQRAHLGVGRAASAPARQSAQSRQYDDEDSDESSDGDFLSIAKPKSFANKKAIMSPRSRSPSGDPSSRPVPARRVTTDAIPRPATATQDPSMLDPSEAGATQTKAKGAVPAPAELTPDQPPDVGPDYSDVFDFEASEGMPEPTPLTPPEDDESDSGVDDSQPQPREPLQMYSTSLAVNITQPQPVQQPTRADEDDDAATPTPAVPVPGSKSHAPANVGSYKGRPIIMPVVVNPAIHEQAAMMGDFNTFVGGLDGRSGMDDGDMNSFRASLTNVAFSGTPRSFTERLMIEDRLAREEGNSLERRE